MIKKNFLFLAIILLLFIYISVPLFSQSNEYKIRAEYSLFGVREIGEGREGLLTLYLWNESGRLIRNITIRPETSFSGKFGALNHEQAGDLELWEMTCISTYLFDPMNETGEGFMRINIEFLGDDGVKQTMIVIAVEIQEGIDE